MEGNFYINKERWDHGKINGIIFFGFYGFRASVPVGDSKNVTVALKLVQEGQKQWPMLK